MYVAVKDIDGVLYTVDADKLESCGVRTRNAGSELFAKHVRNMLVHEIATELDTTITALKELMDVIQGVDGKELAYFNIWKVDNLQVGQKVEDKPDWCMVVDEGSVACYEPNSLTSSGKFWNKCVSMSWLREHYAATESEVDYMGLVTLVHNLEAL